MLKKVELHPSQNNDHYDMCMGMLALLGAASSFGDLSLTRAMAILHCAVRTENFRIYLGSNNRPSAAVVWAFLNEGAVEDYLNKGFLSDISAWNSGDQLWFPHVIAEGGKARQVIDDMVGDPMFRNYEAGYMLRTSPTGKRRIVAVTRKGIKLVRSMPE